MSKILNINKNNLFHKVWARFTEWFRKNNVRKVFLFSLLAAAVALVAAIFWNPYNIVGIIALALIGTAILMVFLDVLFALKEFNSGISNVEHEYYLRAEELYEKDENSVVDECFSDEDMKKIKYKRGTYKGIMMLMGVFLVILIVFWVRMM